MNNNTKEKAKSLGVLVVIPTYNNENTIAGVVSSVMEYCHDLLVVNDGSTDGTERILSQIVVPTISYRGNRGKGYALQTALKYAADNGYRYMLTIDADGQHYASDIVSFMEQIELTPDNLLIGARSFQVANMPGKNSFANRFSNFWFRVETTQKMDDTQSGYRLYPVERLKAMRFFTRRYEFEVEVIVRAAWKGITVRNIPIEVYYPPKDERVSHFKPFKDFFRISVLNSLLVVIALLVYYPWLFIKSLTRKNIRGFIERNITKSGDSNLRIAAALGMGVFFGIIPIWGYQMITAGITAHLLKLNKVLVVLSSNISIPPMIPFIIYGSFYCGGKVLKQSIELNLRAMTLDSIQSDLVQYVVGSVVLALLAGMAVFMVSYFVLRLVRAKKYDNE